MAIVAAVCTGLVVWLALQSLLSRKLDTSRTLRMWQRGTAGPKRAPSRRWLAAAVAVGVLLGLAGIGWWQGPVLVFAVGRGTRLAATAAARRAEAALAAELPTLWMLFAACQQAGLSLRQTVSVLSDELTGSAGQHLRIVQTGLSAGQGLTAAGQAAAGVDAFRRGWDVLMRAEAVGSPVGPLLRRLAAQAAAEQRWQRQARLARLPLWLTLVTICCFLPGVLVVTVLPQVLLFIAQMR